MLLYIKPSIDNFGGIFNLDNFSLINVKENEIHVFSNTNVDFSIVECKSEEEAEKVLAKIYTNMTYGSGNMILNLEDFRKELIETETARTRKALKCGTCIYVDTDGCKEWDNDGTGCDAHITEEEAKKDVNEEK